MESKEENEKQQNIFNPQVVASLRREPLATPHKLKDGALTLCQNPNCNICRQSNIVNADVVYHLDLPGPCPRCGDNSCCHGIVQTRHFTLKN